LSLVAVEVAARRRPVAEGPRSARLLVGRPVVTATAARPAVLVREVGALAAGTEVAPSSAADAITAAGAVVEVAPGTTLAASRPFVEIASGSAAAVGRPVAKVAPRPAATVGRSIAELTPRSASVWGPVVEGARREVSSRAAVLVAAAEFAALAAPSVAEVPVVSVKAAALREAALAAGRTGRAVFRGFFLAVFGFELGNQGQDLGLIVVQLRLFLERLDELLEVLLFAVIDEVLVVEAANDLRLLVPRLKLRPGTGCGEVALLPRVTHLGGPRRLRRDKGHNRHALQPRVHDPVLDAWRHDEGVVQAELVLGGAGADGALALDDDVEVVGDVEGLAVLPLAGLHAHQLTGEAGAVDDVDADRLFAQETARLIEVQYFHERAAFWF
jgi:hypothetical protein